jgi:kynurenine formamidase
VPTGSSTLLLDEIAAGVRQLRAHDVSPTLNPDVGMFFLHTAPQVQVIGDHATHGVASNTWEMSEHSGSHVDAPFHFDPRGATVEDLPLDALFFKPFKKFDLKPFDPQPGEPVTLGQLMEAAARGGFTLEDGDVALLDFGWDQYLPEGANAKDPGWWGANEPGLSDDACGYLATAGTCAVACDTAACDFSIRDGEVSAGTGHTQHFLPNGILIVEGLRRLHEVPSSGLFVALPLKLAGGTASPLRVMLLTE